MKGRAPSPSSFNYQWTYDVFINFRGDDTRYGFTGNLYNALCRKGIRTFMDDEELNKGEEIKPTLLKAIEQSRMAIIIFSKNYASSTFCLDELVRILQCIKGKDRLVWPIFYNVEPSDVRHQRGNYEEALTMHQKQFKASEEMIQRWKVALREASNIVGIHFNLGYEYEYQFIERIVKEISSKINRTPLHIANYPVGLETRVLKIKSLLQVWSNDKVNFVGICGIGGLGKTTIARVVYNLVADQFEGLCFLHHIKEESRKCGLVKVQERMLSEILGEDIKVGDVNKGVSIIKRRFNQKKILLILDNVDKQEQLEKLAGDCDWFGSGSRIIVTTRDKYLLARHGVERVYEVKKFNNKESFELLSWNSFKGNKIDPSYTEVLNCVIQYAQGLPLALEVIGSNLFGKNIKEWKSAIDIYRRIPNEDIQQILKVSYNGLKEVEKEIFLNIACFFNGKELKYVKDLEEHAHGFDPSYGIGVLIDKCLINIEYNYVRMHDLIQDMGREIVRQESPKEPGKRSRLWYHEDIIHVLENNTGTDKILIIVLECLSEAITVNWDGKAFKKMKNLKILIFDKAYFSKGPKYLPNSLRVLQWKGYPRSCLPTDFNPRKLVVLKLPNSCLQSLDLQSLGPMKSLENVSLLDLEYCEFITRIPDLSGMSNLTELRFHNCKNLIEIHDSVGYLKKLKILDASDCANLRIFPRGINLPSLQCLTLWGCSSLEKFPEILGKMKYIYYLGLSYTNLELPFSIYNLIALEELDVREGKGLKLSSGVAKLPELNDTSIEGCEELPSPKQDEDQEEVSSMLISSVKTIAFQECNISDEFLPICLTWFANVKELNLSGNNFTILPACINKCHFLERLYLDHCRHLREIKGIPPNIKELWATNCTSLSSESRSILMSKELHEGVDRQICLPGSIIPEWFDHSSRTPSFSFWFRNKFPAISLCCVVCTNRHLFDVVYANVIINGEKIKVSKKISAGKDYLGVDWLHKNHTLFSDAYGVNRVYRENGWNRVPPVSEWNHVEIFISSGPSNIALVGEEANILSKEVGISFMKEEIRMEDIRFTSPHKRTKLLDDMNWGLRFLESTWTKGTASDKDKKTSQRPHSFGGQLPDAKSQEDTDARDQSLKLKFEIAKVACNGVLVDWEGAERFVQLMQHQSGDRVSDLSGRTMLVNVIETSTFCHSFIYYSILIKGLPLLDKWLQDVLEGQFDDTESDESIEDFLFASLRALVELPVSLNELRTCNVGKTVNRLRQHQCSRIQGLAQLLVYKWQIVNEQYDAKTSSSRENSHTTTLSEEDTILHMQADSIGSQQEQHLTSINLQQISESSENVRKAKGKDIMIYRDYVNEDEDNTAKNYRASSNSKGAMEWEYQLKCEKDQLDLTDQIKHHQ